VSTEGKAKEFRPDLKNLFVLAALGLLCAAWLTYFGLDSLKKNPLPDDPVRFLAGYLPLGVAALIVLLVPIVFSFYASRTIVITPRSFILRRGRAEAEIPWNKAVFKPPRGKKKKNLMDRALISDGVSLFVTFERFFFRDFDLICEVIETAIDSAKARQMTI
jgi:drug/metabolite transporter (DMT)-like permease